MRSKAEYFRMESRCSFAAELSRKLVFCICENQNTGCSKSSQNLSRLRRVLMELILVGTGMPKNGKLHTVFAKLLYLMDLTYLWIVEFSQNWNLMINWGSFFTHMYQVKFGKNIHAQEDLFALYLLSNSEP